MMLRTLTIAAVAALATSIASAQDTADRITVMKSESCGCCNAWIDHLEASGFEVEAKNLSSGALNKFKTDRGIAPRHKSCHTGIIDGYVIEGHVPASDIKKLLSQKPDCLLYTSPSPRDRG